MNRRGITLLILLLVIPLSSGSPPPVPEVAEIVEVQEPETPHHVLVDAFREQLINEIRAEHLVNKTGIEKSLASQIVIAVNKECEQYDLMPNQVLAIIIVESWGNPEALSHMGAVGLMQVMPDTGRFIARVTGFKWSGVGELRLVESNISYGSWYYYHLLEKFDGDEHAAISAYNWGPDNIRGRIREGKALPKVYPGKVFAAQEELRGVLWNEYDIRFWRGLDQYVRDTRQREYAERSDSRAVDCGLHVDDEQGVCVRDGESVPASPGDLSGRDEHVD